MTNDFPFGIQEVADVLGLAVRHDKGSQSDVDCPFCYPANGKKGKLNLNKAKNVYRCDYCGEYGGMIQLYARVHGVNNSDAYCEIKELLRLDEKNYAPEQSAQAQVKIEYVETPRANDQAIHQTYSMLLHILSLSNPHKQNLLSRGLSEKEIVKYKYRSVPAYGQKSICAKLIGSGCQLEGVPGFYLDTDNTWNIKLKASGLLIPIFGISGNIQGMQVRLDKPIENRKYIWFSSSDKEKGVTSGSPVHFVGDPAARRVYVTEGALKGTIAHALSGKTFLCVAGTNSIASLKPLLEIMKANGTTEMVEAFDTDKDTNEHVKKAAKSLGNMLRREGFSTASAVWSGDCKGIDDYFLERKKKMVGCVYSVDVEPDN